MTALLIYGVKSSAGRLEKNEEENRAAASMAESLAQDYNDKGVSLVVNGRSVTEEKYQPYLSSALRVMLPAAAMSDKLGCSVDEYANGTVIVKRNASSVKLKLGSSEAETSDGIMHMSSAPFRQDDVVYIPAEDISELLNYKCSYSYEANKVTCVKTGDDSFLPAAYDMRDDDRVSEVRDQGDSGTCWAFASLAALETTLMPDEKLQFSVDNMTKNNGFGIEQFDGGQYRMSIAYLASWKGPVLEEDDPYGDDKTNSDLTAVRHLQEAQTIEDKDMTAVKEAVYTQGGVETAIYCDMLDTDGESEYYNEKTAAYYYDGTDAINHDVVIVGWDDNYSKDNFTIKPEKDGAFICKNSWGKDFGKDGYFYVSYYDACICQTSVVYTKLEPADNYDSIYQSDKLGWVGVLGYDDEEAYFANVYTAGGNEELSAVAFYATGAKTTYEVYVTTDYEGPDDLSERVLAASGEMEYAGYYTIDLDETFELEEGSKFAVIVHITTPDSKYPVAIEYDADSMTDSFDMSDGEGYISQYGTQWYSAEDERSCNVCLKAFTVNKK